MPDVVEALLQEHAYVLVGQGVVHGPAAFVGAHQTHQAQTAQVVRNRALADRSLGRELADVVFAGEQGGQDADTAGVSQGPEELSERKRFAFVESR